MESGRVWGRRRWPRLGRTFFLNLCAFASGKTVGKLGLWGLARVQKLAAFHGRRPFVPCHPCPALSPSTKQPARPHERRRRWPRRRDNPFPSLARRRPDIGCPGHRSGTETLTRRNSTRSKFQRQTVTSFPRARPPRQSITITTTTTTVITRVFCLPVTTPPSRPVRALSRTPHPESAPGTTTSEAR